MRLDDDETRQALFCCASELRARQAGKPPGVQPWLIHLVRRLELEVTVSGSGQSQTDSLPPSTHEEWIGTRTAAACLGWTSRRVRRHTADLDGQLTSAGWIFPAAAVLHYAEALTHDRDIA